MLPILLYRNETVGLRIYFKFRIRAVRMVLGVKRTDIMTHAQIREPCGVMTKYMSVFRRLGYIERMEIELLKRCM